MNFRHGGLWVTWNQFTDDATRKNEVPVLDKSKMICILTRHSDCIFDITTKDERVFKLKSIINSKIIISSSKFSTQNSTSITPINPSLQCISCDNFDHYYSTCHEFHQAFQCDHIYLRKTRHILSPRSDKELSLTIEIGEMKTYLWHMQSNRLGLNNER